MSEKMEFSRRDFIKTAGQIIAPESGRSAQSTIQNSRNRHTGWENPFETEKRLPELFRKQIRQKW